LDAILISKIDSSTGGHIWTYQYPFYKLLLLSAFQRKLLSTNEEVIVGVLAIKIKTVNIRYIRLIIDPSTGEPKNSVGDLYWDGTASSMKFELLGITIENEQSIRMFFYDDD
jgi:hypothetical protein